MAVWSDKYEGMEKTCKDCKVAFPYSEFKAGQQIRSHCKACTSKRRKAKLVLFRESNPRKNRLTGDIVKGSKFVCSSCREEKFLEDKVKCNAWRCKSCAAEYEKKTTD